jgi:hypothetical protein
MQGAGPFGNVEERDRSETKYSHTLGDGESRPSEGNKSQPPATVATNDLRKAVDVDSLLS